MKVLHIGKYFPPYAGGMENYLRDLMVAQTRQGIGPAALVHQPDLGLTSQEKTYQAGEDSLRITLAAVWARILFTPISPCFPWLLNRMIREQRPDILHVHMPNVSAFWALFLPRARQLPWVVHWHADVLASEHKLGLRVFYSIYRPFEQAILKRCKAVIATSPPYAASSKPLGKHPGKCHVVPLGLDAGKLPGLTSPQSEDDPDAPLKVLAVGRLSYYKGFEYLIRAAALFDQMGIHLVGKGELETRLKDLTRELKLEDRVTFLGHISDEQLAQELGTCDCLCLPSIERTEAFGVVLLEAMSYGKATIVCNVTGSGMGWVVDDGVTGLLVPPENSAALADSMRYLQQNRDKIPRLGESGRQKFDRLFRIDKSAAGVLALYELVLNNSTDSQ